ncbi:hypothetical protein [Nostoc sp.]|uniref:hypothetical protein n=1 Tax=Nostoc sp. TaxID=1180 RepID=UPI002FFAE7A2
MIDYCFHGARLPNSSVCVPLCRASCFSQGETLREQVGEPAQRTGFSAPGAVN